jgi:uncharacterized protein (DUF885 family)
MSLPIVRSSLLALALIAPALLAPPIKAGPAEDLVTLSTEYWEGSLRHDPARATSLGDRRYDDRLEDRSPEAIAERLSWLESIQARAETVDAAALSPADRVTLGMLEYLVRSDIARIECGFEEWLVNPRGGMVDLFNLESMQPLDSVESGRAMVARWRAMEGYLRQDVENLRRGLAAGKVASREAVERVVAQIEELEAQPVEEWALMKPVHAIPEDWTAAQRAEFESDLTAAVTGGVRPALLDYRDFLRDSVLPRGRSEDESGLLHVEGGEECYRKLILLHTTLDLGAREIHEIGLAEVARINDETRALGKKVLGTDDLEEIHRRLRTDPHLHFETRDQIQAKAEEALARAGKAIGAWFGILPEAPCEVVRIEPHEEKHTTIAYYNRPAADGSRPGRFYVNTHAPDTRPRYEAEALAFHEGIPGHHLQISVAMELEGLPEFRKHRGSTAFVEGWGLYTERLSDEMGLYTGDLDRMGMLSFDSWRACRLVVDTGLHALGWSRRQAIDYMKANSCLAENNIINEVDRYIATPGQALAYKLGQREFFALREEAEHALGEDFDIKTFHAVVLGQGAVDLNTLRRMVHEYIREEKGE